MKHFNIWFSMSIEYQNELVALVRNGTPAVEFPTLNTVGIETLEFLDNVQEAGLYERAYRTWNAGGTNYRMWSVYSTKPDKTQAIKSDLDTLEAADPNDFDISGAWHWDGRPIGTQWTIWMDPTAPLEGEPWYRQDPRLLNFMPLDDEGNEPTELTDVILHAGQKPRIFMMTLASLATFLRGEGWDVTEHEDGSITVGIDDITAHQVATEDLEHIQTALAHDILDWLRNHRS